MVPALPDGWLLYAVAVIGGVGGTFTLGLLHLLGAGAALGALFMPFLAVTLLWLLNSGRVA